MVSYAELVNKNGTIYNTRTGQGYPTPAALAAELGIQPSAIQWNNIQANPNYTPTAVTTPTPTPTPAPAISPALQTSQARAAGQPDPFTPLSTLTSTGSPELDALQSELEKYVTTLTSQGKIINPNIELSPATIQQFLDQAKSEVHPYYAGQIDSMKNELKTSLDSMQKEYDLNKQSQEADFKKNLRGTRETLADKGAAYSGFRGQQEQQLKQGAERSIESLTNTAAANAGKALSGAAKTLGSRNISDLGTGSFDLPTVSTAGAGGFGPSTTTRSFFTPGDTTGSLQYNENADVRNLQDFLKQQEVAKRSLAFTG